jgi:hypothetical protein
MSTLKKIFSGPAKELVSEVGGIIDNLSTSNEEKSNAKERLTVIVTGVLTKVVEIASSNIQSESKGNWLQRSWRPITMLVFVIVIVCKWFGLTDAGISEQESLELLSIIKLGLGGYVAGRSVEKVVEKVVENIDIPFLKRKERKQ